MGTRVQVANLAPEVVTEDELVAAFVAEELVQDGVNQRLWRTAGNKTIRKMLLAQRNGAGMVPGADKDYVVVAAGDDANKAILLNFDPTSTIAILAMYLQPIP